MTGYLINLAFWVVCMGLVALYWYRRIDRQSREWNAQREREMAELYARWDARRAGWDAQDAAQRAADDARRAEQEAAFAAIDARIAKADEFWIKRGFGPTPEPKEEPEEEPKPTPL